MRFAIPLAFNATQQWIPLARAAEEAGFETIVVSDHLIYPGELESPYPYTRDGQPPWEQETAWPDPLIAVAAMAGATSRLRFLTSIYILTLRHPVVAAKQVATASLFSGGRLTLGVGAGWMREEFDLLGIPFAARGRRLAEAVEVMRKVWAGGMVEHHGEFYDFAPLQVSPVPDAPVPIWGGGTSDAALHRAATRLDGWASEIQTRGEIREISEKLRVWRADSPLAAQPFGICAAVKDATAPEHYAEMAELGVSELITVPWLLYGITDDDLGAKIEGVRRFGQEVIAPLAAG